MKEHMTERVRKQEERNGEVKKRMRLKGKGGMKWKFVGGKSKQREKRLTERVRKQEREEQERRGKREMER